MSVLNECLDLHLIIGFQRCFVGFHKRSRASLSQGLCYKFPLLSKVKFPFFGHRLEGSRNAVTIRSARGCHEEAYF